MNKSAEKIILKLGRKMEEMSLSSSIKNEVSLEYAILPYIRKFIQEELIGNETLDGVLYHHGRNKEEKEWWSKSKSLQTVKLFGTNVSDMFITHPKIGAVALEFKYVKLSRLTASIQRAVGQSLIATLKHPFAICMIAYEQKNKRLEIGAINQLKDLLWKQHKIYLIIRKQVL